MQKMNKMDSTSLAKEVDKSSSKNSFVSNNNTESPRKINLAFSLCLDKDGLENEMTSDSETTDLKIDVSGVEDYETPKKRPRLDIEESVLEMEDEIERQLNAKAEKTSLSVINVKNVIKSVIMDENVRLMLNNAVNNSDEKISYEPKLTRAKAKELAMSMPDLPWHLTPLKKKVSPQIQALVDDDLLHEDSSDDEYNPDNDELQPSEDEGDNVTCSDVESEPLTPASNLDASLPASVNCADESYYDIDELFKVPEPRYQLTETESIGRRTRSKLCLNQTAIEDLQLVAPDITPDLDHFSHLANDPHWGELFRLTEQNIEDDIEADPNYNVLDDHEIEKVDKEELRSDRGVKVSKKEINLLHFDGEEFVDMVKPVVEQPKKKKSLDSPLRTSSFNNSMSNIIIEPLPQREETSGMQSVLSEEQYRITAMQLEKHVQLMAQHFLMSYMHPVPEIHHQSTKCKENLKNLIELQKPNLPLFNIFNLPDAMELVNQWEEELDDEVLREDYIKVLEKDVKIGAQQFKKRHKYTAQFHPKLSKMIMESKALMYPTLLPHMPFRAETLNYLGTKYSQSEKYLLAIGLEKYSLSVGIAKMYISSKKFTTDALSFICKELMPHRNPNRLLKWIEKLRPLAAPKNPIQFFFRHSYAPSVIHDCPLNIEKKAPKDQELNCLPVIWQNYFINEKTGKNDNSSKSLVEDLSTPSFDTPINNELRYEIVYMMPNMPSLDKTPVKQNDNLICITVKADLENYTENLSTTNMTIDESLENNDTSVILIDEDIDINSGQSSMDSAILEIPVKSNDTVLSTKDNTINNNTQESSVFNIILDDLVIQTNCSEIINKKDENKNPENSSTSRLVLDEKSRSDISVKKEMACVTGNSSTISTMGDEISIKRRKSEVLFKEDTNDNTENASTSGVMNLPQLRKTTPRLAKIRSAQNMKLMTQVSSSSVKSRTKNDASTSLENSCGSSKGDNEAEIAELMLASTTIKKDTANRKKAKQAREIESIKRLLEAEKHERKEERATKFAESYIQKLHETLESSNPETLKTVIKYYLEYSDKLEDIEYDTQDKKDKLAIDLYNNISTTLKDYPMLCFDFLLFLTPQQAQMIDKINEHAMMSNMSEFINVSQIYFAKQPSRISKILQAVTQLTHDTSITMETMLSTMEPLLKGQPLIMDLFLKNFPNGKPPESLFVPTEFENLTCPVGPYDKQKIYTDNSPELYENIELGTSGNQEDHYGGDNCKCNCHNVTDTSSKSGNSEHCRWCGVKYLNGRIYLQTSEGLRPAKVTFEGDEDEKLENIARISMKTTERCVSALSSTGRRRKSSKNDLPTIDESSQKQSSSSSKMSPIKETDESEKITTKTKRGAKSPPKSIDQRKLLKSSDTSVNSINSLQSTSSDISTSPIKSKREKRAERREAKSESKNLISDVNKLSDIALPIVSDHDEPINNVNQREIILDSCRMEECSDIEMNQNSEPMEISFKSDSDTTGESEDVLISSRPWTRQEDTVLLQKMKDDYSDNTFKHVSESLGDRTIEEVKERWNELYEMLQTIV